MRRLLAVVLCWACPHTTARALDIIIMPGRGLEANSAALAAFDRAAGQWESLFLDPITININADLTALGSGVLGTASSVILSAGYGTVRNSLISDAGGSASFATLSALPAAAQFAGTLPPGFSVSGNLAVTKAEAKALGVSGLDAQFGASDASIVFSSAFTFSYDRASPVAGAYDFQSVAAHEIGHALGFLSVVDTVAALTAAGQPGAVTPFALDLFRFVANGVPASLEEFSFAPRSLVPGAEAAFSDAASAYAMSTGVSGDGYQASHWKNSLVSPIGIMNPVLAAGQIGEISPADLLAFDLIGYDLAPMPVPEPSTLWLTGGALALLVTRCRLAGRRNPPGQVG